MNTLLFIPERTGENVTSAEQPATLADFHCLLCGKRPLTRYGNVTVPGVFTEVNSPMHLAKEFCYVRFPCTCNDGHLMRCVRVGEFLVKMRMATSKFDPYQPELALPQYSIAEINFDTVKRLSVHLRSLGATDNDQITEVLWKVALGALLPKHAAETVRELVVNEFVGMGFKPADTKKAVEASENYLNSLHEIPIDAVFDDEPFQYDPLKL